MPISSGTAGEEGCNSTSMHMTTSYGQCFSLSPLRLGLASVSSASTSNVLDSTTRSRSVDKIAELKVLTTYWKSSTFLLFTTSHECTLHTLLSLVLLSLALAFQQLHQAGGKVQFGKSDADKGKLFRLLRLSCCTVAILTNTTLPHCRSPIV